MRKPVMAVRLRRGAAVAAVLVPFAATSAQLPVGAASRAAFPVQGSAESTQFNFTSTQRRVSGDGRYSLFLSNAPNLDMAQSDTNNTYDIFVFDRVAGTSRLVSGMDGGPVAGNNGAPASMALSADGRYVAFESPSTNLVSGVADPNGSGPDVFLLDTQTSLLRVVSRAVSGSQTANDSSTLEQISEDGRYVLFSSSASNLVSGVTDANAATDVFRYDRVTDTTELVSGRDGGTVTGSGATAGGVMSANGQHVAFVSSSADLRTGFSDTNGASDVFRREMGTGTLTLVSRRNAAPTTGNEASGTPRISADGRYVLFQTGSTNLVAGVNDNNGAATDLYRLDLDTDTLVLASGRDGGATATGNGASSAGVLDASGRYVAFSTAATNIKTGVTDGNGNNEDVFLADLDTSTLMLLSGADASPTATANSYSNQPLISADGRYVTFSSAASDLVAAVTDTNGTLDVYRHDTASPSIRLVSGRMGSQTQVDASASVLAHASADGRYVAFTTTANDFSADSVSDTATSSDVFVRDVDASGSAALRMASKAPPGQLSATAAGAVTRSLISRNGRFIAFTSNATNLVAGQVDLNGSDDVFVYDLATGTTRLASGVDGSPDTTSTGCGGNTVEAISDDGRYVLFRGNGSDLVTGSVDNNGCGNPDLFRFDAQAGTTILVSGVNGSPTQGGNGFVTEGAMTPDGRYAVFSSYATGLVSGVTDGNSATDVFRFDAQSSATILVSGRTGGVQTSNGGSSGGLPSADGRYVVFQTAATNLRTGTVDNNGNNPDIYRFDTQTGAQVLVSRRDGTTNTSAAGGSDGHSVTPDGRYIVFRTMANNLKTGVTDANGTPDVFRYDADANTLMLVSGVDGGSAASNHVSEFPTISDDGRFVAFSSSSSNVVTAASVTQAGDVYVFDTLAGVVTLVSTTDGGATGGNAQSLEPWISGDGSAVVFRSAASNLFPGDGNQADDVFRWDRGPAKLQLVSLRAAGAGSANAPSAAAGFPGRPPISSNGHVVLFESHATDLVADDHNLARDAFHSNNNTPGPMAFPARTGVAPNTLVESDMATVADIIAPVTIKVSGGSYSIGCNGAWSSSDSTIANGETVCVRHLSAPYGGGNRRTRLTIDRQQVDFLSTTAGCDAGFLSFKVAAANMGEGQGERKLAVSRTGGACGAVSVQVAASGTGGAPAAPSDFSLASTTLDWPADVASSRFVAIQATQDLLDEASETLTLELRNAASGASIGTPGAMSVTLIDDDPLPVVSFKAASSTLVEGGAVAVQVQLNQPAPGLITVPLGYAGTAGNGGDYTGTASVSMTTGATGGNFYLAAVDDGSPEGQEAIVVTLGTPTGATVGAASTHTVTVRDQSVNPVVTLLQPQKAVAREKGAIKFFVSMDGVRAVPVTVSFMATGGTATAGADYTLPRPITLQPGQITGYAYLLTVDDTADETPDDETVILGIDGVTGGAVPGSGTITLTIQDND